MAEEKKITGVGDLVGMTPLHVAAADDEMLLKFAEGTAKLYHEQDCCETVSIDDVNGDLSDLKGVPLLVADERKDENRAVDDGTETWTFYTFRTIKGSVDVRWCGTSNGYYSEEVNFDWRPEGEND